MNKTKTQKVIDSLLSIKSFNNVNLYDWQRRCCKMVAKMFEDAENKQHAEALAALISATCGTGKTMMMALIIKKLCELQEAKGKHALIFFGSHRIALNEQHFKDLKEALKDMNIKFMNWSSGGSDLDRYDKDYIKGDVYAMRSLDKDLKKKHVIVIYCDKTINDDVAKNETATDENMGKACKSMLQMSLQHMKTKTNDFRITACFIDEAHKDIKKNTVKFIKKNVNYLFLATATPNKFNEMVTNDEWKVCYTFKQALQDGKVVGPRLKAIEDDDKNHNEIDDKASSILASLEHMMADEFNCVNLCVFDNKTDDLVEYGKVLIKHSKDADIDIDIATVACAKQVPLKKGNEIIGAYKTGNTFNGKEYEKTEDVLELYKKSTKKIKVILSAYKIQEGINIPDINGIVLLGMRTDAALVQAICRGDRVAPGKTHFNVYVPQPICDDISKFIYKLTEGFDDMFDFGSDEDHGAGCNNTKPLNLSPYKVVDAIKINIFKKAIRDAKERYYEQYKQELLVERVMAECTAIYNQNRPIDDCWYYVISRPEVLMLPNDVYDMISLRVENMYCIKA